MSGSGPRTDPAPLVRSHTLRLTLAQVLLWTALGVWARLITVQIDELTGRPAFAGLAVAIYYVASGIGARATGFTMDRSGRRVGLLVAYAVLGLGGLGSYYATELGNVVLLLIGTAIVGLGSGGALLGRAAVADMHRPTERGRAVGRVIVVGALGAVIGPFVASAVADLAGPAIPWLLLPGLSIGGLAALYGLRPDPRELAPGGPAASGSEPAAETTVLRTRPGAAAAVAIGVSQAVMATFMAIVPVVLNREHAAHTTVSLVVSLHLGAMFLFSPQIGAFLDRRGRKAGLLAGLALSGAGVILCSFLTGPIASTVGLLLIGVGWSSAYLGSTALVSDLAGASGRARALGATDLVASLSAAAGVLAGSALLQGAGVGALGGVGIAVLAVPFLLVALLRELSPGRWTAGGRPEVSKQQPPL